MTYKDILYDTVDGIAKVTLNIPKKMNRLSIETMKEVVAALKEAKEDESVQVIIIQGVGESAFCAGADLGAFMGRRTMEVRKVFDAFGDLPRFFIDLGKPSIAAVSGIALAGGCGLAIYPDITVASEKAKFGLSEINVGLWPCMVSAALPRVLGRKRPLR
jgi:enoyl-CoA hydratase/carnithine racemase